MTDWNWFFSALAQAVAALVGILMAFVITKIVGNQSLHRGNVSVAQDLLREAVRLRRELGNRRFEWYNAVILRDALRKLNGQLRDNPDATVDMCFPKLTFSRFMRESVARARILTAIDEYPRGHNALVAMSTQERELVRNTQENASRELQAEDERILRLTNDVRLHADKVAAHAREIAREARPHR